MVMGMLVGTLFALFVLPTFYVLIAKTRRPASSTGAPSPFCLSLRSHNGASGLEQGWSISLAFNC